MLLPTRIYMVRITTTTAARPANKTVLFYTSFLRHNKTREVGERDTQENKIGEEMGE